MGATASTQPVEVVWTLRASTWPMVRRHCPGCGTIRPFASRGRFRMNAQQRRLDVWLLYGCRECDHTWKLTVLERVTPESIGPARRLAFERDDVEAARAVASDVGLLRRGGVIEWPAAAEVSHPGRAGGPAVIRFDVETRVKVRLDRVLAAVTGVPRARLSGIVEEQEELRRNVVDGCRVGVVRLPALAPRVTQVPPPTE